VNRKARRLKQNRIPTKKFFRTSLVTVGALLATQTVMAPRSFATAPAVFTVTNCLNSGPGSFRQALGKRWTKNYSTYVSTISGADDNSVNLSYDPVNEQVSVYENGNLRSDGEVTAVDSSSIQISGGVVGDVEVYVQPIGPSQILFASNLNCPDGIIITEKLPQIRNPIDIVGPGANRLTIDFRSIQVSFGLSFTTSASSVGISGLTLRGRGILGRSDFEIDNVHFQNVGGWYPSDWTYVVNNEGDSESSLVITNSTFSDSGLGVSSLQSAMYSSGSLEIENSTFVGNVFQEGFLYTVGDLNISNSTFVNNSFDGPLYANDAGSSFYAGTELSLFANIFTNNELPYSDSYEIDVCQNNVSPEVNLFDIEYRGCQSNSGTNKVIASLDSYFAESALNGGTTPTIALLSGSPAIDYYTDGVYERSRDQRGFSRPSGSGYDVGAFEYQADASSGGNAAISCVSKNLGSIGFKPNSDKLSKATKKSLDTYADSIVKSGCKSVTLNGHTSARVKETKAFFKSREALAHRRALAVENYLKIALKKYDSKVVLKTNALGAKNPISSNKSESGRKLNRRVEIIIN
jgi:outer membrane protein OmpA-like peptidoglycan-associated protein